MNPLAGIVDGILAAGLFVGGLGMGAAAWRLIGRLVGGSWSEAAALVRLSRWAAPALMLAFAARAVLTLWLPPWGTVAWLSPSWLIARSALEAVLWLGVAWIGAGRPSRAVAAAALVVFGALLPLVGFDLITSREPGWVSSAEGYALAVRMLGAALALALLVPPPDARDRHDLQGLLVATLLATLYLALMSYLVPWYGDLPEKTGWIRLRHPWPWQVLIAAALGLGAVVPLPLLALQKRLGEGAARAAAALALLGFLGQTLWLTAPGFGRSVVFVGGGLAIVAVVLFVRGDAQPGRDAHAV